jgi:hypothetical protein
MEGSVHPEQKKETVYGIRKRAKRGLRRITTLRLLANDSRSRGARIQGGWIAITSDGGYEA